MSEQPNAATGLETDEEMDTGDLMKQAGKIANSTSDVVLKWILLGVLVLFGTVFFFQWRQNSSSPERLITIMQESVKANTDSLKVQEASLAKIQEFSIRVPIEHASAERKLDENAQSIGQIRTEQSELRAAVKANTEAVQANTKAVAELIEAMKDKMELLAPKNGQPPPN
jgi:hypothetical protein